jgi:hypothetical protein
VTVFRRRAKSEDAVDQHDGLDQDALDGDAEEGFADSDDIAGVDSAEEDDAENEWAALPPAPRPDGPWDSTEVENAGAGCGADGAAGRGGG